MRGKIDPRDAEHLGNEVIQIIPIDDFFGDHNIDHALILALSLFIELIKTFGRDKVLLHKKFFELVYGKRKFRHNRYYSNDNRALGKTKSARQEP